MTIEVRVTVWADRRTACLQLGSAPSGATDRKSAEGRPTNGAFGSLSFGFPHRMLQIQVHMESSQVTSRQSGTDTCLSSSTMMLASRPSDCQCVDFNGPSSYLSRKNRGWLRATVWNIWSTRGEEEHYDMTCCYQKDKSQE